MKFQKKGVNWVKSIPSYQSCMNNDAREELNHQTAFEVYYGRKDNSLVAPYNGEEVPQERKTKKLVHPKVIDYKKFKETTKRKRKLAKEATERCANRMVKRHLKKYPPSMYSIGGQVLVRVRSGKHHEPRKYRYLHAKVIKKNLPKYRYKVQFHDPEKKNKQISMWLSVKDITGPTKSREEKHKKSTAAYNHRKKFLIPLTHDDHINNIPYTLLYDPPGDGNCQFAAVAHQLRLIGIHRSPITLRSEVVNDLIHNPYTTVAHVHLREFVGDWSQYILSMSQDGTYGDHVTLQRAAHIYNVQFIVHSSLGPTATQVISPTGSRLDRNLPILTIGHLAEGHGEHYVSLESDGVIPFHFEMNNNISSDHEMNDGILSPSDAEVDNEISSDAPKLASDNDTDLPSPDSVDKNDQNQNNYEFASEADEANLPTMCNGQHENANNCCVLPPEILRMIIKKTLQNDIATVSSLNQVSHSFRDMTADYYPFLHISLPFAEDMGIVHARATQISVRHICQVVGKGSGLMERIKEILHGHRNWFNAWLVLKAVSFSRFLITSVYWKTR